MGNLIDHRVFDLLYHDIVCPIWLLLMTDLAGMRRGTISTVMLWKVSNMLIIRFTSHGFLFRCRGFSRDTKHFQLLLFTLLKIEDFPIDNVLDLSDLVLDSVFLIVRTVPRQVILSPMLADEAKN